MLKIDVLYNESIGFGLRRHIFAIDHFALDCIQAKTVGDGALDVPQVIRVINGASKAPPPTYFHKVQQKHSAK